MNENSGELIENIDVVESGDAIESGNNIENTEMMSTNLENDLATMDEAAKNSGNLNIMIFTVVICVIFGIILGIVAGRKAANK